jgi:hypothetical protein
MGMLLITVLLNYGTLAKLILAKLASKNRMPGFMRPGLGAWVGYQMFKIYQFEYFLFDNYFKNIILLFSF